MPSISVDVLFYGFPGKANNTFLGWSTIALVKTAGKNILVDTGGAGARPMLLQALKERGLEPHNIDCVFLSHLHFDHVANINVFPHAVFVLSQAEWEYANTHDDVFVYEGALPLLRSFEKKLIQQDGEEIAPGVSCLHTPGHTPGCLSLVLSMPEGKWVIAGDAVKNRQELRTGSVGITLAADISGESIRKVRGIARRVLPGHDCWLRIEGEKIEPETENEIVITFPAGISIDGKGTVSLRLDRP
jgi:N-acyl homoserine lactone hydrolase